VPWAEHATLIIGLLFCAANWALFAGTFALRHTAAADVASALEQRGQLYGAVALPLGLLTTGLTIVALLRAFDLRPRRSRLQLTTALLMFAILLVSLAAMDPIEHRLAAAAATESGTLAVEVARLGRWEWVRAVLVGLVATTLVLTHRTPLPIPDATSPRGLTPRHRTILLLVGAATLFEGYDRFIASLALPYIGRDLNAGEGTLGTALAVIRIGALISVFLGRVADRHGRRRLLIVSVAAYTIATAATGLSRGMLEFAAFQLVATIFLTSGLSLAQVVIAEEFPPAHRGFGQGILGAFGSFGAGIAAMLFPLLQRTQYGWRGMYLIGVLPLVIVVYLQRNLPETQHWQRAAEQRARGGSRVLDLLRPRFRGRLSVLSLISAFAMATGATAFSFASYRATTTFGWNPAQVSSMIIGGGAVGFFAYFALGRWSDFVGRRGIGALGLFASGVAASAFYQSEWLLPAFALMTVSESAIVIAVNSLTTELFPTELRATAKTWVTNSSVIGALLGLALIGASSAVASLSTVITVLGAATSLLAPTIFMLPESRHVDLQAVAAAA